MGVQTNVSQFVVSSAEYVTKLFSSPNLSNQNIAILNIKKQ